MSPQRLGNLRVEAAQQAPKFLHPKGSIMCEHPETDAKETRKRLPAASVQCFECRLTLQNKIKIRPRKAEDTLQ